jgi:hypothetical protein
MNRRDVLKSAIGGLCTFLIPAPRPRIDLAAFCARNKSWRYDMRQPFQVDDWIYATDAKAIIRVRPSWLDKAESEGPIPPAALLPWDHDKLRGWKPLRKLPGLLCDDSNCPECDGTGFADGVCGEECGECNGFCAGCGRSSCDTCHGRGVMPRPGVADCPACQGKAIGRFPAVVKVDGRYFDVRLYRKVASLGGEAVVADFPVRESYPAGPHLKFRFDGGDGILMGMDAVGVERRLVT